MDSYFLVLGFLVLIVAGTIYGHIRIRRIASMRVCESYDTFRTSFDVDETPEEILRAVYAKVQEGWATATFEFPVRADDVIADIFGMVNEDLDDAVIEVLADCGRQLPPKNQLVQMRPIITVRDFVLFIADCTEHPKTLPATEKT